MSIICDPKDINMSYQKCEALQRTTNQMFCNTCTETTLEGKQTIGRASLQEEKRDHEVPE